MRGQKLLYSFILIIASSTVFSQVNNERALKLYSNFGWSTSNDFMGYDSGTLKPVYEEKLVMELGYFSPTFLLSSEKGNKHEFELSRLLINQTDEHRFIDYTSGGINQVISGEQNTKTFIALRYEYGFLFFKNKDDLRIKPSLGLAARPYYSNSVFKPAVSSSFTTEQLNLGALFSIVPRIEYNLNDRWFLDLNVPVNLLDLNVSSVHANNPAFPIDQRTITTIMVNAFPSEYLIRFGVGVRL